MYRSKRNTDARSRNHSCREETLNITYSECVSVALVIQQVKRKRRTILLYVVCPIFEKKIYIYIYIYTEHKMRVLISSTTFVWNISHSKKNWAIWSKMCIGLHAKCPSFLSDFNETWIFSTDFRRKKLKCQNPSSGSPVVPCGRTDWNMTKLIVAFCA
jgi:hypothetical protein